MSNEATGAVFELTAELLQRRSVTPEDAGCQQFLGDRLAAVGFELTPLRFGAVDNLWAHFSPARNDNRRPLLVFAGHTDVVPTGPLDAWHSDPFTPTVRDGFLYGRGAADMKASLAAMVVATERLIASGFDGLDLAFLITSDEEGPATDGTVRVVDWLHRRNIAPDYCIVGEPSSSRRLGDIVRNGRRGSLNGTLTILGEQGHVAYPEQVDNPIHAAFEALALLTAERWDEGNDYYPPTSLQFSNARAGTGATNVVPGSAEFLFNFRYSTEQTAESLKQRVHALLDSAGLRYRLDWSLSGEPFLTPAGTLTGAVERSIAAITGEPTTLSTAGGTSDGRFIARLGTQIVELGPVNATIHQLNERVAVSDLEPLAQLYEQIARELVPVPVPTS